MQNREIAILGVGAIGGTIGGPLTQAGYDVTLIDQWPENVQVMKTSGLTISGTHGDHLVRVNAIHIHELCTIQKTFDWVFICVKSYDTAWATTLMLPYLKSHGAFVSAQNSINDNTIAELAGFNKILACILTLGGGMYEPGKVIRTNDPESLAITVGELHGQSSPRLLELESLMSHIGLSKTTNNTWGERWSKLVVNCMVNPMAGITGLSSAEIRRNPATRRILIRIAAEAIKVGMNHGFEVANINGIPAASYLEAANSMGAAMEKVETEMALRSSERGEGLPSMLQDLMKVRKTEIDYLNGYVVEKGAQIGMSTPLNHAIVDLLTSVEKGHLKPSMDNLSKLKEFN
jgi:2-dehydropantoate 2-reductase